ncbi:MAG: ABC transporter ATP-binding protein [Candidatus Promineifilaceae bacterium]
MSEKNIIEIKNVSKIFKTAEQDVVALDNINLDIQEGGFNIILGPSGCGKSTLLYLLGGFDTPTSGEILLDGNVIKKPGPDRGFVFQDYALFPWKTVLGNIMFGLTQNGHSRKDAREIAMQHVKLVDLEGFENAYTHTLSGGMRQRVSIARALAYNPKVLLMDEPFGALDAQTRSHMQHELVEIWQQTKKTVVFVTHSVSEAVFLADRVIVMKARPGQVRELVDVDLPRPRNETGDEFTRIRQRLLKLLEN